ncbi:MAG: hypothetical protein NVSMB33_07800 [Ktedonobacteraceae bacterium]
MIQQEDAQILNRIKVLDVQSISTPEAFITLRNEWEALLARAARATAFQSSDWLALWWRHLGAGSTLRLLILRDADKMLVGIVPLQMRHYGIWPLRLRVLFWLGHGIGGLTDTLGPVFAAGYEKEAICTALSYLRHHQAEWDLLALARTPALLIEEIIAWAQAVNYRTEVFDPIGWLYASLPGDWSSFQKTLSKNLRSNLPRYRNRLVREGHNASFEVLTESESIIEALPRFFELHQLRAQAEDMKSHSNYFATPTSRTFITEAARNLGAQKRLALAQMIVDDRVVAAQLLLFQDQVMSTYFSGFDPEWGRYSIMMLTMKACIEYAIAQGIRWVDLTAGAGSQTKRQWGNEETQTSYVLIAQSALIGTVGGWVIRKWRSMHGLQHRVQLSHTQQAAEAGKQISISSHE